MDTTSSVLDLISELSETRFIWLSQQYQFVHNEFTLINLKFNRVSERQISIYKATDLSAPINTVGLDVSPAILIPFYDEDSSTLFLTGKVHNRRKMNSHKMSILIVLLFFVIQGDSTIYAFEITDEAPHICPLSHHRSATSHQGLSFLTKNHCDVSAVEFAKAFRLTNNTIEPLSFTVPRIKVKVPL